MKQVLLVLVNSILLYTSWSQLGISFLKLEEDSIQWKNYSYQVTTLKMYVSHISFYKNGMKQQESDSIFLIDFKEGATRFVELPEKLDCDSVSFMIGVDSTISVSGVMGGDLDPLQGMYWTWQSGYIHVKLELEAPDRTMPVTMHLGGYANEKACYTTVGFKIKPKNLQIRFNLEGFLNALERQDKIEVMSPSSKAVKYMHAMTPYFVLDEKQK